MGLGRSRAPDGADGASEGPLVGGPLQPARGCAECSGKLHSAIYMLNDQAYCTTTCRLAACRREARRGKGGSTPLASEPLRMKMPQKCRSNARNDKTEKNDTHTQHMRALGKADDM